MGFFSNLFGFQEQTGSSTSYSVTKSKLLEIAKFQEVPLKHASYYRERCDFYIRNAVTTASSIDNDETTTTITAGIFSMPSLMELRQHVIELAKEKEKEYVGNQDTTKSCCITVRNIVGDARALHTKSADNTNDNDATLVQHNKKEEEEEGDSPSPATAVVVIQAASQFNFLEFPSPSCIPETGISNYIYDRTQGPACAIACAAGTAYRNYLIPVPFPTNTTATTSSSISFQDKVQLDNDKNNKNNNNCKTPNDHEKKEVPTNQIQQRGQTKTNQLNGLVNVEQYLIQETKLNEIPWIVKNGYVESSTTKLNALNTLLCASSSSANNNNNDNNNNDNNNNNNNNNNKKNHDDIDDKDNNDNDQVRLQDGKDLLLREQMISRIRIGIQEDTTVTDDCTWNTKVTQTYNSALSIGYSKEVSSPTLWEPLAQIVLEATYEATLLVGVLQSLRQTSSSSSKPVVVYLTKVGGGVFGNKGQWIRHAMKKAIRTVQETYLSKQHSLNISLDIRIVHYGWIDKDYRELEEI